MEEFVQKLNDLLHAHFSDSEVDLELANPRRVGGFLVWEGFSGHDQIDRQREVWKFLRQELSADEQTQVSAIITLTPEEMKLRATWMNAGVRNECSLAIEI